MNQYGDGGTEAEDFRTQRFIGILYILLVFTAFSLNLIQYSITDGIEAAFLNIQVYPLLIIIFLFFLTTLINHKILRISQFALIGVLGLFTILDQHDSAYGVESFLLFFLIGLTYGYFRNRIFFVIIATVTVYLITAAISVYQNYGIERIFISINSVFSTVVFIGILLFIYRKELKKMNRSNESVIKKLREEKSYLETNIFKQKERLQYLDNILKEYEKSNTPVDLETKNITPGEFKVLKILCVYRGTDREIGEKLNIAENTVGIHLQRIRDKLGVDNRYEIIDLCRNNFKISE